MTTNQVDPQQRVKKQKEVKQKIQEIMQSVKQQKQFIENKLATNDQKIQIYCEEYESLKELNDFTHLKKEEEILIDQITKGLQESGIDPSKIIRGQEMGVQKWQNHQPSEKNFRKISNQQIIAVQTMLIDKLASQLLKKQGK